MHLYVATVGELDLIVFDSDCSLFFFFFFSLETLRRCDCILLYVYIDIIIFEYFIKKD